MSKVYVAAIVSVLASRIFKARNASDDEEERMKKEALTHEFLQSHRVFRTENARDN